MEIGTADDLVLVERGRREYVGTKAYFEITALPDLDIEVIKVFAIGPTGQIVGDGEHSVQMGKTLYCGFVFDISVEFVNPQAISSWRAQIELAASFGNDEL